MTTTKIEFAVPLSCQSCVDKVSNVLNGMDGIKNFEVDLSQERVVIESSLPIHQLHAALETSGKRVIITGVGSKKMASAVAVLGYPVGFSKGSIKGVVRFTEVDEECVIDGTIDGLKPGPHGFHIYSSGDLSQGCDSIGDHYNPYNRPHGGPDDNIQNRHLGDLGNIISDESGRAAFRIIDKYIKVHDLIGRSVAVTAQADDLGRGSNTNSKMDGNSGERIGCGIIARSAGILENTKRICLCSGLTLWDEKGATI
ncbi:copper chaperone for superoxide dismutase-like isoform X1 [Daphnia carinata]|uniref:copper chaperone for superoxide dismutase-like isoform X1 n=1 Tax=Daphnia carinata TaxID=120202 RepID=UPI00257E0A17|nr:copper chaperone for superoxide dismutase-like isoform X1 [Daphnia carinata]